MSKIRFQVQMDATTKEWCQQQADFLGVSLSGFINVAVAQYRQQQEGLTMFRDMPNILKMMEGVKVNVGSGD